MKTLVPILIIVMNLIIGCERNKQSSEDFIIIDVMKKYPKKELILQDFMDVEYIQLDTSREFVTMAYLQAIGKDMIIVRNRNRSSDGDIFIFDKKGKGIRKINHQGASPEEYSFLLGITLDEENSELFINDHYACKIFVYDLFGKFKRSFEHKKDIHYDQIHNFDQSHLICHDGSNRFREESRNLFLIISKQDGSVIKEIQIPFEKKKTNMVRDEVKQMVALPRNEEFIPIHDNWLLVEPSSDTIYRFLPNYNMIPFIARTPSIQSMDKEVFLFPGVCTDHYYFMQVVKKEYDFEKDTGFPRTDLMYDRLENAIYECEVYNADFSNKEPINMSYGIMVINNEIAFVHKLEAPDLIEAYEQGKLKGKLKEIAATLEEEANPVIMIAKYKK